MRRENWRWLAVIGASVAIIAALITVNVLPASSPAVRPASSTEAAGLRPGIPAPLVGPAIASAVDSLPSTEPTEDPDALVVPGPVLTGHPSVHVAPRAALTPRTTARPLPAPVAARGVFFAVCADARAAGAAPILRGAPGYRAPLDRDSDGIACEIDVPAGKTTTRAPTSSVRPGTTVTRTSTPAPVTKTSTATTSASATSSTSAETSSTNPGPTGPQADDTDTSTSSTSATRTIVGDPRDVGRSEGE